MGVLVEGRWQQDAPYASADGRFRRAETTFRDWVTADGSSGFAPEPGRYHLYVAYPCPWAHRTLILRKLKGLERAISLSVADPYLGPDGWFFSDRPGCTPDTVNGARFLREVYLKAKPDYTGRVTVPVLWDKQRRTIVNNESAEIMRMFDTAFDAVAERRASFYPEPLRERIDQTIQELYRPINNGVYRAGFARTQEAYEEAVRELFAALDYWEQVLSRQSYLCGDRITEADWCLFTTLFRFDLAYHGHFKCNLRRLVDYSNLWNYTKELYQVPGVAETCNIDHVKWGYYGSHESINPTGIRPLGPVIDFGEKHDRGRLGDRRANKISI
jgi:putative glutathione S-transferase